MAESAAGAEPTSEWQDALCEKCAHWARENPSTGERICVICEEREEARLATLATLAGGHAQPRPLYREIAKQEPFPTDSLGPTLAGAAGAIRERIQAPESICAQSVLGAAALAVQGFADVELPMGSVRPVSLNLLSIAESGERKTSADELALRPVRERERVLAAAYAEDLDEHRNLSEAWEMQRKEELKKCKSISEKQQALEQLGPEPERPLAHLLTCPEPTLEGLTRLFFEGQPSLGLFSSEGGQFIGGHGMNKDNRLKTAAALNTLWDGNSIRRVRSADGSSELPGRRLSIHLLVQPQVARELLCDPLLGDIGSLSRLLIVAPAPLAGTRLWREPSSGSAQALDSYNKRLAFILSQKLPVREGSRNALAPRRLQLSQAARNLWIRYSDVVEMELREGGSFEPIKALANKLPEHATRLAAVVALTEDIDKAELIEEDLARGIDLAQFYVGEALRLFEMGSTDPELLLAQKVLDWLQTWPEKLISLPDLYQNGPRPIRDAKRARRIVALLEGHGWLVPVQGGGKVAGTHRKEVWEILG